MRSQRLRVPANPGHERDRSPKRTRPLSPLDPDKRRSLSCPAGRPPRPDPASPVDSFAVPSLRYSGRNRRTVHPSPYPSPYPDPLTAPQNSGDIPPRRQSTLNPDQVEPSRSPQRYEDLNLDHVDRAIRSNQNARGILTQTAKEEFVTKIINLLRKEYQVTVEAVWSRPGDDIRQTVIGDVYMKHPNDPVSLELVVEWDGDVNTAYRFPHPDITYHDLTVVRVRAKMPGGQPVESLIPSFERVRITDPKSFSPYDPVTWQPWIDTEDLFKPRDLIRELREAPQLGVRFNPPPQRDRLFKILIEWIYAARLTEGWMEKHNLAVAELIIEELRNLYWAAAGVAVERVQQRLHRDDDPKDRYGQLVLDEQLRGRPQVRSSRRRPFCFSCHQPGHIRADCPQMAQAQHQFRPSHPTNQDFRGGVAGGAVRYAGATRGSH